MKRKEFKERIKYLLIDASKVRSRYMDIRSGVCLDINGIAENWLNKSDTKLTISYSKSRRDRVLLFWNSKPNEIFSSKFAFNVSKDKKKLLKEINNIFKPSLIKFKNIEVSGCVEDYTEYSDKDCGSINISGDIEVLFSRNALKATIKNLSNFINDSWSTGHMIDDGTRMCRVYLNPKVMNFIEHYNLEKEFHNEVMKYCKHTIYNFSLRKHDNTHTYILNYIPKKDVIKILDK